MKMGSALLGLGIGWFLFNQWQARQVSKDEFGGAEDIVYRPGIRLNGAGQHSPTRLETLRSEREDRVEQESDESFPASDPPSWTPTTSLGQPSPSQHEAQPTQSPSTVQHNPITGQVDHSPTRLEAMRDEREDRVEQESDESFPASDPPSWTPTTSLGQPTHPQSEEEATWTTPNAADNKTEGGQPSQAPPRDRNNKVIDELADEALPTLGPIDER